jgi:hypothetical protein
MPEAAPFPLAVLIEIEWFLTGLADECGTDFRLST